MKTKNLLNGLLILITFAVVVQVKAEVNQSYDAKGVVGFGAGSGQQLPVNPNSPDPTIPVTPKNPDGSKPISGGDGALTIDFTSSFDFGTHAISNQDQTYFAKAQVYFNSTERTPNYAQVTDKRGTFNGWQLNVKVVSQFKQIVSGSQKYPELIGASISLKNPTPVSLNGEPTPTAQPLQSLIPGVETQVASATSGAGGGTWVVRWGDQSNLTSEGLTPDITLFVPGVSPKDATAYQTTLKWILAELPTNSST